MPRFRIDWTRHETYTGRAFIVADSKEQAEELAKELVDDMEEPLFSVDQDTFSEGNEDLNVTPDETTKPDPSDIVLGPQSEWK